MRIVVLSGGTDQRRAGWHVRDLARAAQRRGHDFVHAGWHRLVGRVGAAGPIARDGDLALESADVVLLRTMPPGTLEQVVFRMDLLGRLEAGGVAVINPPRAIETAVDKYLALARMESDGIPVPPTIVCQRPAEAMEAFEQLGSDVILKPLFGSEGFGISRLQDAALAERAFHLMARCGSTLYLQKTIDHGGSDLRLLVVGGRIEGSMRRRGAGVLTNIARGGVGERVEVTDRVKNLALRAAAACGCELAGVDVAEDRSGAPFVLEVNAVPGWRRLAQIAEVDAADRILAWLENRS